MKKAIIYLRVSTAAQADKDVDPEGYSIPAQRTACYRQAETLEAEVVDEFIDRGESARSADRPQMQAMLARLRDGGIDYVIVHKLDRLARNREDDVVINLAIRKAGARLVSTVENIDDTPSGKLVHGIMATIAEWFSANNGTEALKGMTQKAMTGGTPGRAPEGYRNVREIIDGREIRTVAIDPERAPLVQWAFETYATGETTVKELTAALEERGLRSIPSGKRESVPLPKSRVAKMLNNRYYLGIVTFNGVEYPGRHEALISPDLFLQAQDVMSGRRHATERERSHDHYLKGSVFCGRCHSRLCLTVAKGRWGGMYTYFFCTGRQRGNGCRMPHRNVDDVEIKVEEFYRTIQLEPDRVEKLRKRLRRELAETRQLREREARRQEKRLERLKAERSTLMQALYAKAVPMDLFKAEQDRIGRETAEAERVLAGSRERFDAVERTIFTALDLAGNLYEAYRRAPEKVRRLFNQAFFENLWVDDDRVVGAVLTDHAAALLAEDMIEHVARAMEEPTPAFSWRGSNTGLLVRPEGLEPPTF